MSSRCRIFPHKSRKEGATSIKTTIKYNIASMRYNEPLILDMAVVIAFFNPAKSLRIIQNLYTVKYMLELSNIPVYIGEVAHNNEPFVLPTSPTTYQYRSTSIMFYKENIMTQVIKNLPDKYEKVILLDADIIFTNPDWYNIVSQSLNVYDVVQPYKIAQQLDITFSCFAIKSSILSNLENKHEGYAWAFCRSWLKKHPLFEYAVIGGGDTIIYNSLSNYVSIHPLYEPDVNKTIYTLPNTNYVDLEILHLPHGSIKTRQYGSRHERIARVLKEHALPSLSHALYKKSDGIFEWKPEYKSILNDVLLLYFNNRDDDGI